MSTPLRVLIVEDSESDMILMVRELHRQGYDLTYRRVETAATMRDALDNQTWDVILSDYSMPTFSALAALEVVQATGLDIPFIIVSGTVGEEAAVAAMKAGAHDFFPKDKLVRLVPAIQRELREADERRLRRRAEEELRQTERRFATVFQRSPVPIGITRFDDSYIVDVNEAFVMVLGYGREELVGFKALELGLWVNADAWTALMTRLLSEDGSVRDLELQGRAKSGEVVDLVAWVELIELGDTPHVVSMFYDVTELRQMEQELLQAERMRVEIEKERELIQLKERFISVVSHEFRTPLSVIMTAADLVQRYYDRLAREEQIKHIQDILNQSEYMATLIEDVLTVNKARAGRLELNPAPLDLIAFCQTTLQRLEAIDKGEHRLTFTHTGDLSEVVLDVKLLQHIILNLLTNALKYSPDGGDVHLDVSRQAEEVVIQISDHGIGIPPAAQARLFEPFHRAENVGTIHGTGLGMAIVKESVDLHGGTIACESETGVGTTFTVRLPAQSTTSASP